MLRHSFRESNSKRALAVGFIVGSLVFAAWAVASGPGTPARTLAYRGNLELGGIPLSAATEVVFSFSDDADAAQNTLDWEETHTVTPLAGAFAVVLGLSETIPDAVLHAQELYLQVTVEGTSLSGMQRLHPTWTAHRANNSDELNVTGDVDVAGDLFVGGTPMRGNASDLTIENTVIANAFSTTGDVVTSRLAVGNALEIVGQRLNAIGPTANRGIEVVGFHTEDGVETTYTRTLSPWIVSASDVLGVDVGLRRSVTLDDTRLLDYCGDIDGCTIRMAMAKWDPATNSNAHASMGPHHFNIDPISRQWRLPNIAERSAPEGSPLASFDGDGNAEDVFRAFDCVLTDGEYSGQGAVSGTDAIAGFHLLNIARSGNAYRPLCVLTIED